jgi:hypothetical protein
MLLLCCGGQLPPRFAYEKVHTKKAYQSLAAPQRLVTARKREGTIPDDRRRSVRYCTRCVGDLTVIFPVEGRVDDLLIITDDSQIQIVRTRQIGCDCTAQLACRSFPCSSLLQTVPG